MWECRVRGLKRKARLCLQPLKQAIMRISWPPFPNQLTKVKENSKDWHILLIMKPRLLSWNVRGLNVGISA